MGFLSGSIFDIICLSLFWCMVVHPAVGLLPPFLQMWKKMELPA